MVWLLRVGSQGLFPACKPSTIYRSLIFPYTLYGVPVWGQASQCNLKKDFTLQKRALRLIFLASKRSHAIPLFVASNILPANMLYFETVSTIMHDVSTRSTSKNIHELFIHSSYVHVYNTRFLCADNLFVQKCRLHINLLFLRLVQGYGIVYTPNGVSSRKEHLKGKFISCS